jgi:hypothetical protein
MLIIGKIKDGLMGKNHFRNGTNYNLKRGKICIKKKVDFIL